MYGRAGGEQEFGGTGRLIHESALFWECFSAWVVVISEGFTAGLQSPCK